MPPDLDLQYVLDRLNRVERRLRRIMHGTGCIVVGLVIALGLGAAQDGFNEITARRFVVSDEDGNPRGLWTSHQGSTVLSLFDTDGNVRARLSVHNDGHPELTLLDQDGAERIRLAEQQGAVLLTLDEADGGRRIQAGRIDGEFGLNLLAGEAPHGVQLRVDSDQPQVLVKGGAGHSAVRLFSRSDRAGVSVSSADGTVATILALLDNLRPLLMLETADRRTIVTPNHPRIDQMSE
jgi:hypothetical protein